MSGTVLLPPLYSFTPYIETALLYILSFPSKNLPNNLANINGLYYLRSNARRLRRNVNANSQRTSGYSLGTLSKVIFLFLPVMKDSVSQCIYLFIVLPCFLFIFFKLVILQRVNYYTDYTEYQSFTY